MTEPTRSETPRTDAVAELRAEGTNRQSVTVPAKFARQLERELAAARAELDVVQYVQKVDALRAELAAVTAELQAARTACDVAMKESAKDFVIRVAAEHDRAELIERCAVICDEQALGYRARADELYAKGPLTFEPEIDRWNCRANQAARSARAIRALSPADTTKEGNQSDVEISPDGLKVTVRRAGRYLIDGHVVMRLNEGEQVVFPPADTKGKA